VETRGHSTTRRRTRPRALSASVNGLVVLALRLERTKPIRRISQELLLLKRKTEPSGKNPIKINKKEGIRQQPPQKPKYQHEKHLNKGFLH
jgi:hypothetical protein